ncbi:MAG: ATP-binding protein [Solirubrobacteraceae bacterium]
MKRRRLSLLALLVIGVSLVLAIVIVSRLATLGATSKLKESNDNFVRSSQSLILANDLEQRVIDLETGLRGYLLTGERSFLAPRSAALRVIPSLERSLQAERERGDGDLATLRELYERIERYAYGYQPRVLQLASHDLAGARDMSVTSEGKRLVDQMRAIFARFAAEQARVAARRHDAASKSVASAETIALIGLIAVPVLILLGLLWTARSIVAPVRRLASAAERIGEGDLEARVSDGGAGEIRDLAAGFNTMAASLRHSRDELEAQNAELEAQRSELESSVDELAAAKARAERFHTFVARLAEQRSMSDLGAVLLEELAGAGGADAASLYVVEDGQAPLVCSRGFDRDSLPAVVRPGEGLAGMALAERRSVTASHPYGDAPASVSGFAGRVAVRHELHLPIGHDPVLAVASFARIRREDFARHELETLEQMAEPATVAIANVLSGERSERTATLNQTVLETANDAYMATDEHGRVVEWTPHAEQMFGWSREEALGKPVQDLTMAPKMRHLFAAGCEQLIEAGRRGEPMRFEATAMHRDGRSFVVEVSAAAIGSRSGWTLSAFVRDIDERVRRSRERQATEAVSRALAETQAGEEVLPKVIDALAEAMDWRGGTLWEWDETARGLRCAHVTGRGEGLARAAELVRRSILTPDSPESGVDLQAFESGEVSWAPLPADSADETVQELLAVGIRATITLPLRRGETKLGLLRFILDSEKPPPKGALEALASIADLVSEVVGRRAAEQEAERLKSEFFALVSHELRTPLTSIVGYIDIVRAEEAGEINERQARYLGVVDRNARRLIRLVGDLLFVAQVEAGTLSLERGEVDLGTVAAEAVEAARPHADGKGVLLTLDTQAVELRGADRDRLGQLLDNLLTNALKFTDEGGRVEVRVRETQGKAHLEVSDSGIGIAHEELDRLFERFYRAQAATDAAIQGIGLGLSICKAIVEAHGGSIAVASELGKGPTFTIELPTTSVASETATRR